MNIPDTGPRWLSMIPERQNTDSNRAITAPTHLWIPFQIDL